MGSSVCAAGLVGWPWINKTSNVYEIGEAATWNNSHLLDAPEKFRTPAGFCRAQVPGATPAAPTSNGETRTPTDATSTPTSAGVAPNSATPTPAYASPTPSVDNPTPASPTPGDNPGVNAALASSSPLSVWAIGLAALITISS